jgi:integrase
MDSRIFSIQTLRHYCQSNVTFAEWCRDQFGIKRLADITPEMATAFLARLRLRALSPATINTYVCAIRKLDMGLRHMGWRRRKAEPLLSTFEGRRADVTADPYSLEDAERLIAALTQLDPQYGQVARLQRISGLRVSEAVHLQVGCIAPDGSHIRLQGSGTHTKGGRPRHVPILPQHQQILMALREQGLAKLDGHVFHHRQSLTASVKRAASRLAAELDIDLGDGTHSFRKLYANELYQYLLEVTGTVRAEARAVVTRALGHNRLEVLKAYLVNDDPSVSD